MRINYVIATWDGTGWNESHIGARSILDKIGNPKGDDVLALHLSYLSKLKHSLSQITIMKPKTHNQPKYDNYYINAERELKKNTFTCPVIFVESDYYKLYSYGQWLYSYETFGNEFDYYIFVEDDTVAAIPYFDIYLTTLFQHRIPNQLGYLCSKTFLLNNYHQWDKRFSEIDHLAISTGITNTKTLRLLFETYPNIYNHLQTKLSDMGIQSHPFTGGNLYQVTFSLLFVHNNLSAIRDYSNMFSSPFYSRDSGINKQHTYREYGVNDEVPLIMPVTMVVDGSVERLRLLATFGFLEEKDAHKRMQLMGINHELSHLDLSNQHLNDTLLPIAVGSSIRTLDLSHNLISDVTIPFLLTIPLIRLNLDNNHISDEGIENLTKHKTLQHASLNANHITLLKNHPTIQFYVDTVLDSEK